LGDLAPSKKTCHPIELHSCRRSHKIEAELKTFFK
jgi:hypothetical protein